MVMEAPPSPQSVGREFVRQYYTLLNKAPTHLHRFYNHHSSFVHGGLDPPNRETSPVIGQKQIHQKIQQLNFRDCHAKITQVDSQATLGKGVVVQVTGELSNAGQPMRRFTQTFVLAAQSPKKYYVHNDIFRYQDEIISDEECEGENRSEPEDDVVVNQDCQVLNDVQQIPPQVPNPYYNPNTTSVPTNITAPPPPPPPVHHQHPHVLASQTVPTVNGNVHPDEINVLPPGPVPTHLNTAAAVPVAPTAAQGQLPAPVNNLPPTPLVQPSLNTTPAPPTIEENSTVTVEEQVQEKCEINYNNNTEPEVEAQDMNIEAGVVSNIQRTYANLVKSSLTNTTGFNNVPTTAPVAAPVAHQTGTTSPQSAPLRDQPGMNNRNVNNRGPRVNQQQQQQQQQQQPQRIQKQDSIRSNQGRNNFNDEGDEKKRSVGSNYGDMNQLFLGKLPHNATEDELREIFSEFGTILDLRVHSKPTNKTTQPGARAPSNYGFITYETQAGVQNCLTAKPIYYPKDDKNGVILNVEEKKTKDRPLYGNNRLNNNDNRPRDNLPRRSGGGMGGNSGGGGGNTGQNRNNTTGPNNNNTTGVAPSRTNNNYNRSGGGGGGNNSGGGGSSNRGSNAYNRR